ncbi:hypothetical protein CHS0354_020627 [Potamilus streckersoni]|uniref:FAD-dependent oxidoreductase domain-containing protein 2 n=1 Tax=Potamilus streckersoni TaxID=2493646 RepID=A0AAE0SQG0_9BIVA|nr:hypothetical protein CHS0354_020627 [Potamilus streckersoni]
MNSCPPSARIHIFHVLVILLTLTLASCYHDYCIIGAGPSGLQMGYFFKKSGRDYIIFEKSNVSGDFFTLYPRHKMLISINKRYTGKTNKEFNLRHDWNSLLSDDESLLFRHYSKEMFPNSDDLVRYLHDYQTKLGLNVQFNTYIHNIQTMPCEAAADAHVFTMSDQHGNSYRCGRLIVATGVSTPNIPNVPGIEHADGYESMSINPDDYEGKTVLILGRGNSAFELANSIYGSSNLIHMMGRSRVRLAWATHYVGDLRAVNNDLLDTYQLKSLDGVLEAGLDEVKIVKIGDKFHLQVSHMEESGASEDHMYDNFAMREPYDIIVRCLGFKFDSGIFNLSSSLKMGSGRSKKYPNIGYDYESVSAKGMFVAGTASHSLDFRKSAGGFIHGFRYTGRALHRLLEWRYHQVPWPITTQPVTNLLAAILKRLNEASGIYQMFSSLADVVIFKKNNTEFDYLEEFPINLLHELPKRTGHEAENVLVVNMQYGEEFSGPGNDIFRLDRATGDPSDAHNSNFLHPCLYYFDRLPMEKDMKHKAKKQHLPTPKAIHHIVEDFLTTWNAPNSHILPLRRFLENVLDTDMRHFHWETCMEYALTRTTVPLTCQEFFLKGQGMGSKLSSKTSN